MTMKVIQIHKTLERVVSNIALDIRKKMGVKYEVYTDFGAVIMEHEVPVLYVNEDSRSLFALSFDYNLNEYILPNLRKYAKEKNLMVLFQS